MIFFPQSLRPWRHFYCVTSLVLALTALPLQAECNSPPQAVTDDVTTLDVQTILLDPLANDFDPEGQPLSLHYLSDSCLGSVAVSDDTLTFSALAGVAEVCSISYRAVDSQGASSTSSISITVQLFASSIFEDGFESGNTVNWSATIIE